MLGTTREKVIGIPCSDIWKIENCHTDKCGYKLLKKGVCKSDFKVGDQIYVSIASYIRDRQGEAVGHIELINNVTESANREFGMKQLYDAIFASNNVVEFSAEGIVTNVNQNLCDLFGSDRTTFIGKPMAAFIGEEETAKVMQNLRNGKYIEITQQVNAAGKVLPLKQKFMPLCNKEGVLQSAFLLTFLDQEQELRRMKDELQKEVEVQQAEIKDQLLKLHLTMKAADIGLYDMPVVVDDVANPKNTFIYAEEFKELLGYSSTDDFPNIFSSWSDRIHPEERDMVVKAYAEQIINPKEDGEGFDFVYRMLKKNGEYGYFRDFCETIRNTQGTPIRVVGGMHDVTKEQEQMQKLSMTMQAADIGLYDMPVVVGDVANPKNTFVFSDEFKGLLGYSATDDFPDIFSSWSDRIHPEERDMVVKAYTEQIINPKAGAGFDFVYRMLKKNSEYGYFRDFCETIRDLNGQPVRVVGGMIDVTKEQEQMQKLNMTLHACDVGMWDMKIVQNDPVNPNNAFTWSDTFRKILGYTNETDFPNILSSWTDRIHPEDLDMVLKAFEAHITDKTGKTPYYIEYRASKKNGEWGYFRDFGETQRDEEGNPLRVVGGFRDITKDIERNIQIQNHEFELEQMHDLISDALNIAIWSPEGNVLDVNQNLLDVWGIEKDFLLGKHYSFFVSQEGYTSVWADMHQGKTHADLRYVVTPPTGKAITFRHNFIPIHDRAGKLLRVMMLAFPEKPEASYTKKEQDDFETIASNMDKMESAVKQMKAGGKSKK